MKKLFKIFMIILIILIVILIGRRVYYNIVGIAPIDLYLTKENSEETIETNRGSYQWNDKGIYIIADSVSASEMEFINVFNVKQGEKISFSEDNWTKASAVILLEGSNGGVTRLVVNADLDENYIEIPTITGEFIMQLNFESKKGNVWYAVKLNIEE